MSNLIFKLRQHLLLLFHPVLINAYLFGKGADIKHENWGDDINWYFLKEIIRRPVALFDRISLAMRMNLKNYLVIGSTIDMLCKTNTEVWGAGIIYGNKPLKVKPRKVHSVRGPLTRKILIEQGIDCPEVYGDPALLVAKYYQPQVEKRYKYGFIPHRSNIDQIRQILVDGTHLSEHKDILIIDLSKYDKWTDIPDQICSCENIISGSLHGIIMAEAYKIPNVWIEFGKPLIGGHFKFHDFFLSIGRDRKEPIYLNTTSLSLNEIDEELVKWKPGYIDLLPLISAAPFSINTNLLCD